MHTKISQFQSSEQNFMFFGSSEEINQSCTHIFMDKNHKNWLHTNCQILHYLEHCYKLHIMRQGPHKPHFSLNTSILTMVSIVLKNCSLTLRNKPSSWIYIYYITQVDGLPQNIIIYDVEKTDPSAHAKYVIELVSSPNIKYF